MTGGGSGDEEGVKWWFVCKPQKEKSKSIRPSSAKAVGKIDLLFTSLHAVGNVKIGLRIGMIFIISTAIT